MACIELIGCTGAGKSTLVGAILRVCRRESIDAWRGEDFVLKQVRFEKTKNEAIRAGLVNLIAISFAVATLQKNFEFFKFAIRFISQMSAPISWSEKLYIGKNIFKNIGIYEIARLRISPNQIVFLDEGPLHTAQVLFVRLASESQAIDLSTFVSLVPTPDIAIYLQRDEDVLIERTLARKHKRIVSGSRILAKSFIRGSIVTFDKLIQYPKVEQRLLKIDSNDHITVVKPEQTNSLQRIALKIIQASLNLVNNEYMGNGIPKE